MKNKGNRDNPWRAAGLVGALGLDIAICTMLGYFAANFAVQRFGGPRSWIVAGVMLGLFAGIATVIMLLKKFLEEPDE
ncbi:MULTISPECIES: AtpZ/AtpI family protein [Paenibacillus]|uniref:AtpZ/AtpI family protein n=1 Tax=Paenibacillus TaxID=44249 RepID=UPI001C30005A|nr:AtpZ/AtpI family protein [Paenibacillus sp. GbtcB18]